MRHYPTNNPYIDIAIILLNASACILTALKGSGRVVDIGGYSDVGSKDIIQLDKPYTTAATTLGAGKVR